MVPSLTYETFGIVMLEAFARKTPVIARRLGALPEIVEESGGGLTFETDDELAAAIATLARSPLRRRELGERGYAAFVEKWTRQPHLSRYFDVIQEARGNRARSEASTVPFTRGVDNPAPVAVRGAALHRLPADQDKRVLCLPT